MEQDNENLKTVEVEDKIEEESKKIEESEQTEETENIDELLSDSDEKINQTYSSERQGEELSGELSEESTESKIHGFIHSMCVPVLIGLLAALILTQVIFFHAVVPSGSMETTIMTGDRLVGSRVYLWFSEPKQGDIMIFWSEEYDEFLVKRVIGCPGDYVEIKNGHVYVNGSELSEEYVRGTTYAGPSGVDSWIVPEDSYFMLGDNRENSADSRYWNRTFTERSDMYAKVLFRYSLGKNGYYLDGNID